jgi:hypothetical protein
MFSGSLDDKIIFYFGSANPTPRFLIKMFVEVKKQCLDERIKSYIQKNKHRTKKSNTECGMYSIFFIVTMLTGDIGDRNSGETAEDRPLREKPDQGQYMIRNRGTIFNSRSSSPADVFGVYCIIIIIVNINKKKIACL